VLALSISGTSSKYFQRAVYADFPGSRGAGQSQAHTTWRSLAEYNDYISFIGFMAYYIRLLALPVTNVSFINQPKFTESEPELHNLTPVPSQSVAPPHIDRLRSPIMNPVGLSSAGLEAKTSDARPVLLMGGYSYGAMITSCLPAILSSILEPFQSPAAGSAYAEIRMRAESLALQQSEAISVQLSLFHAQHRRGRSPQPNDFLCSPTSRKTNGGMRTGGTEGIRRASHDSHRSRTSFTMETQERVRKSVDRVRSLTKQSRHQPRRANSDGSWTSSWNIGELGKSNHSLEKILTENDIGLSPENNIKPIIGLGDTFRTAYLLVSPLQGFVGGLLTLWSFRPNKGLPHPEFKFGVEPTLALFADDDAFVAVKKLRTWAQKFRVEGVGKFRYREVKGAGHFWHDRDCQMILRDEVKTFVTAL
jgi:hypothetical protein